LRLRSAVLPVLRKFLSASSASRTRWFSATHSCRSCSTSLWVDAGAVRFGFLVGRFRLAVRALALLNWGDFPSCFLRLPDRAHGLVVGLHLLGDLPVGFLRRRLDQLGDQIPLLPGGEVAAVNVGADDEGNWVVNVFGAINRESISISRIEAS